NFTEFVKEIPKQMNAFTVEYDFRMDPASQKSFWVDLDNNNPFPYAAGFVVPYQTSTPIKAFNRGVNTDASLGGTQIVNGIWYHFRVDIDPVAKVYDIYLDDKKIVDGFVFRNE